MFHALRLASHQLWRQPRFTLLTVMVMGLAIAAATTVFTVVDSVVLQPLPYGEPDHLVAMWAYNSEKGLKEEPLSPVNFMDHRDLDVYDDAAAWWRPAVNLVDPGMEPARVRTIETSANLFEVVRVKPQLGAGFPEDGPFFSSDHLVAVISDRLWRTRYGADRDILGKPLSLNGTPYEIVGVMPPGFHYPDDVDVWQRLRWDLTQHSRHAHFMEGVARLAPDAPLIAAQSATDGLAARLATDHADSNAGRSMRLVPLLHDQLGYYRPALLVLFGAVALLLVIGVLNVSTLLYTRSLAREREISVRVSLGASPWQLLRQLLAEASVLAFAGAAVGLAATALALPLLGRFVTTDVPRLASASIDLRALGLCLAVTATVSLILGLAPARQLLRPSIGADLRSGERGSSRQSRRVYSGLVAGEIALACALLVGSALLVRTVGEMTETPVGVTAEDALTVSVQLSSTEIDPELPYAERWGQIGDIHARILEEVRRQPGVRSAGSTNFLPFDEGWRVTFMVAGQPPPADEDDAPQAQFHSISEGYLPTMGGRLAAGRDFGVSDGPDAPGVLLVNETFARRHLGERPAVGQSLLIRARGIGPLGSNLKADPEGYPEGVPFEVVGVMDDVRNVPLGQTIEPAVYFSTRQFPFAELTLAVDAADPARGLDAVKNALAATAPTVPVGTASTWGQKLAERTAEPRLLMRILSIFAVLAAVLAAAGVYGLVSWSVTMRRRELAIRQVLGASPIRVGRLVLTQSALLVTLGLAIGLVIVRVADKALQTVLYQVQATDPAALIAATTVLLAAAALACAPALLRAMRVDPAEGLRVE